MMLQWNCVKPSMAGVTYASIFLSELEAVSVQVNRVSVVGLIIENQAVAPADVKDR
jgi:hypothetical protein